MHASAFLKKQAKKKAPAIGFLVPFCVQHSKGFMSALVTRANKNFIPYDDVVKKFLLNAKIWFSTDVGIIQVNYVLCQYFIIFKVLFS